jgi:ubiquitin carboxyl-terminal hydrolase 14
MTEEEKAKYYKDVLQDILPIGIMNMGNTCYLNSTLQVMKKIPELRKGIDEHQSMTENPRDKLIQEMKVQFRNMDNLGKTTEPTMLLTAFFNLFPMFAERTKDQRAFQQQDADECFQMMLQEMKQVLRNPNAESEEPVIQIESEVVERDLIKSLFEIKMQVEFQNLENPMDKSVAPNEFQNKLACIIADQDPPINYVNQGISTALLAQVEKQSPLTGENAIFEKKMRMANLPPYLTVQKIRFVWKEADVNTGTEGRKAKIFKKVLFPLILDTNDFLTTELQKKLEPNRKKEIENELAMKDQEKDLYEKFKEQFKDKDMDTYKIHQLFKKQREEDKQKSIDGELWSKMEDEKCTGKYRLFGVITHKGRSSESGHYISWIHHKGESWIKFDDDLVTKVKEEEILNLHGGGDWHTAYYLVYRRLHLNN